MSIVPRLWDEVLKSQKPRAENQDRALHFQDFKKPIPEESSDQKTRYRTKLKGKKELNTNYWLRMDKLFDDTMGIAKLSYRTIRIINIIIVCVGLVFICNSIALFWMGGPDQSPGDQIFAFASGGMGMASFVAIFFTKPQKNISRSLGNLAQIHMIYKSHSRHFETISDYDWEKFLEKGSRDFDEVEKLGREFERMTEKYSELIQKYIEKIDPEK